MTLKGIHKKTTIMQKRTQDGNGSAENKGHEREEQINRSTTLSHQGKQDLTREIENEPNRVGIVQETGGMSGRDDYSGSDNDRMENENNGEGTDKENGSMDVLGASLIFICRHTP